MRRWLVVSAALMALAACIGESESTPAAETTPPADLTPTERDEHDPTTPGGTCPEPLAPLAIGTPLATHGAALDDDLIAASVEDPLHVSLGLIVASSGCLETLVVAAADSTRALALATMLASVERLPLLVLPGDGSATKVSDADRATVGSALAERETTTVLTVGGDLAWLVEDGRVVEDLCTTTSATRSCRLDDVAALIVERSQRPLEESDTGDPADTLVRHAAGGDPALGDVLRAMLYGPQVGAGPHMAADSETAWTSDPGRQAAPTGLDDEPTLWLGDVRDPVAAVIAATTAAYRGEPFVGVDGSDLRAGRERTETMRAHAERRIVFVGEHDSDTAWQLSTVLAGTPLPGGGFLPLEDQRIVGLYGAPGFPGLGALGQQDLDATIERARSTAEGYGADGRRVVPGFDLIATVASANAGDHGDYSQRIDIETLRPLVDRARLEEFAVILDLQPGRTSFLDQAMEYEELLRQPHVGLALDPEWRIGPHEVHLVRIGSVEAEEVQQVADWLAGLVRRERLPQKVFMLHQFVGSMLPDRDTIVIPPELVGVVHVDGQGTLRGKYRTYDVMSRDAIDQWEWGWKNFLAIDRPVATPEQVLDLDPLPLIVTYQ